MVLSFITAHWAVFAAATLYLFLAAVETAPVPGDPRPVKQQAYQWLYDFLHVIANKVVERQQGKLPLPVSTPPAPIPHP